LKVDTTLATTLAVKDRVLAHNPLGAIDIFRVSSEPIGGQKRENKLLLTQINAD